MAATERKIPGTFAPVPGGYSQQIGANTALFIPDFSVSRYDPSTGEVYGYAPDYDALEAANAYYRKHKTLRGYASLTDEQADAITDPEAFSIKLYGKPYGDFELSSLRGKIKRVQARLADLDKLQAAAQQPDSTTKFDGGEIVRNAEENRLQILFDEIPDADTRDALKSNGFRWSPRNKAWQRQLTQNAEYAARRVLGL